MDQEIIARYIKQPACLPPELCTRIEREWGGEPVQLYALADLDDALVLSESWVALGPSHVAIARRITDGVWDVRSIQRARIRAIQESPGMSANALVLLDAPSDPPLAVIRYTQRQRGAFENIRFVLDEAIAGRSVVTDNADRVYADAVARPVRDAQALVSGRDSAVILRLLPEDSAVRCADHRRDRLRELGDPADCRGARGELDSGNARSQCRSGGGSQS